MMKYILPPFGKLFLLVVFLTGAHVTSAQIINTIAGSGPGNGLVGAYGGDGGAATSALLNWPAGVAIDPLGNVYICDQDNNVVRKVNAGTGIITTIAGIYYSLPDTGLYGGDGGPASQAYLFRPSSVALDKANNIYVADTYNNRIRKIDATTGIISTFVGTGNPGPDQQGDFRGDYGPATAADISLPGSLVFDTAGNLFFCDGLNNRVRKVDAATGIITTVAGNGMGSSPTYGPHVPGDSGQALFSPMVPVAVAVDAQNNLYIADAGTLRVRKVNAATGIINTIAGNGWEDSVMYKPYMGDGGPATNAQFYVLTGVALDTAGNIYVTDCWHQCIRRIDVNTGIINTVAGNGTDPNWVTHSFAGDGGPLSGADFFNPGMIAFDLLGNMYISDDGNSRVRKVTYSSNCLPGINLVSSDTNICRGSSVTFNAAPYNTDTAGNYQWQINGAPVADNSSTITVGPLNSSALVTCTLLSNAACDSGTIAQSIGITINVDTGISLAASKANLCPLDTASICAPAGYSNYRWSSGDTTACIYTSYAGNYTVTVTSNIGCTVASTPFRLNDYPPTPVTVSQKGDTLTCYTSVSYQWFYGSLIMDGETNQVLVAGDTGTYTVLMTDSNGCTYNSAPVHVGTIITTGLTHMGNTDLSVFPNPVGAGNWQISVAPYLLGAPYRVFDDGGKLVFKANIQSLQTQLGLNFAAGVYLLQIDNGNETEELRLVKQ